MILDSELNLNSANEIVFSTDLVDLNTKIKASEKHSIICLIKFLATSNSIVCNNLVLNLYKHFNNPTERLYLSRQVYNKALNEQFYLALLDAYIPQPDERAKAFLEIDNIPSIKKKIDFCFKWMNSINNLNKIKTTEDRRKFLMNIICFSICVEEIFSSIASAYVDFLKSKELLPGLTSGTRQIFKNEALPVDFTMNFVETVKKEDPSIFNEQMKEMIIQMLEDAIDCEMTFAEDFLSNDTVRLSLNDMRQYLEYIADQRLENLGIPARYNTKNPFEKRTSVSGISEQVIFE